MITIIMSAYNSSATIGAAVDSLLCQTHENLRLVVYDDASTDGTAELLARYDDPRLDLRLLTENRGLTRNLHEGVAKADTPYIARMDADDIALPDRIARQLAHMQANPDIDVLGTNVIFFDDQGNEVLGRQPEHHDDIAIALFFNFTMMHPTVMMRTSALRKGGWNYDLHFRYSQDFDLWSRMIRTHRFANLQDPLLRLREHPNKISRAKRIDQQRFTSEIRARQILNVLPDATQAEIAIFALAARGDLPQTRDDLLDLEAILLRLIQANTRQSTYPVGKFNAAAADQFHMTCRCLLDQGRHYGTRFLRSPLRPYRTHRSLRSRVGFLARSGMAYLGLRHAT